VLSHSNARVAKCSNVANPPMLPQFCHEPQYYDVLKEENASKIHLPLCGVYNKFRNLLKLVPNFCIKLDLMTNNTKFYYSQHYFVHLLKFEYLVDTQEKHTEHRNSKWYRTTTTLTYYDHTLPTTSLHHLLVVLSCFFLLPLPPKFLFLLSIPRFAF